MARSDRQDVLPAVKPSRQTRTLLLAAGIYTVWLVWLAYVAWVNVIAGNQ